MPSCVSLVSSRMINVHPIADHVDQARLMTRALATARILSEHDLDVDALDGSGRSALHRAAAAGELEMVELLLAARASLAPDAEGNGLLAAAHAHPAVVVALWRAGATPDGTRGTAAGVRTDTSCRTRLHRRWMSILYVMYSLQLQQMTPTSSPDASFALHLVVITVLKPLSNLAQQADHLRVVQRFNH